MTTPKERAVAWAAEVAADPNALFLDLETTGLGDDAEICDLALVSIGGGVLIDSFIKPVRPIPAEATQVHGITDEMVQDAPTWFEIYERLRTFGVFDGLRVVIYNSGYDSKIINQVSRRHGLPDVPANWQCAMKAHADFMGIPGKYPGQFRWHKLDDAARHFSIEPGGHRALPDTQTCRLVVLAMAALTKATTPAELPPASAFQQPLLIPDTDRSRRAEAARR